MTQDRATTLKKLYQRRLKLRREFSAINVEIQRLEKSLPWIAPLAVHHTKDGCAAARVEKRSADWDMVDCILCHNRRAKRASRPPPTFARKGEDWVDTVKRVK